MKSRTLIKILPFLGFICCITQNIPAAPEADAKPVIKYDSRRFRAGLPYLVSEEPVKEPKPAEPKAAPLAPVVEKAPPAKPAKGFFSFLTNPPAKKPKTAPAAVPEVAKAKPAEPAPVVVQAPPAKPTKGFFSFLTNPPAKKLKAAPVAVPEVAKAKPAEPAPVVVQAPPAKPTKGFFSFLTNPPPKKPKAAPAPKVSNQNIAAAPAPPRKSFFSFLQKKEPPKAMVVESKPAVKKTSENSTAEVVGNPDLPSRNKSSANDGLRLPDMLTLPGDNEFESTNPAAKKTSTGTGAVISRPPTDPPSRPKSKEKEGE